MSKWCSTCNNHKEEPFSNEISKYAKFWRDNRCYCCDTPFHFVEKKHRESPKPLFKVHEVVAFGSDERKGQDELDSLLAQGWQIVDVHHSETWTNYGDASYTGTKQDIQCRVYKLKFPDFFGGQTEIK